MKFLSSLCGFRFLVVAISIHLLLTSCSLVTGEDDEDSEDKKENNVGTNITVVDSDSDSDSGGGTSGSDKEEDGSSIGEGGDEKKGLKQALVQSESDSVSDEKGKSYPKVCNQMPNGPPGSQWTQYFFRPFRKCPPTTTTTTSTSTTRKTTTTTSSTTTTTEPPPHKFMSFDPNRVPDNEHGPSKPDSQVEPKPDYSPSGKPGYQTPGSSYRPGVGWGNNKGDLNRPSRPDDIPGWGPPPKEFRPFGGGPPGWGSDLFHEPSTKPPPPESSDENFGGWIQSSTKKPGWGWGDDFTTKPPPKHKGWGWGSGVEKTTRRYSKGWGSGGGDFQEYTTRPPKKGWGWKTSEKPWNHSERPGWTDGKGPCCQSGHPYFTPSFGPGGPTVVSYTQRTWSYDPSEDSGEGGGGDKYRTRDREPSRELEVPPGKGWGGATFEQTTRRFSKGWGGATFEQTTRRYSKGWGSGWGSGSAGGQDGGDKPSNYYLSATPFPTDADGLFESWKSRGKK